MTFVERCLYDYKANCAMIKALAAEKDNLMSVHGQNYFDNSNKRSITDPVSKVTDEVLKLEKKIVHVQQLVTPINNLIKDLSGSAEQIQQMAKILELKYIAGNDNFQVMCEMNISESTYWRRVRELLRVAKKYFGKE